MNPIVELNKRAVQCGSEEVEKITSVLSNFPFEQDGNVFIFDTFYKNGNLKNWWTLHKTEISDFSLTRGGIQLVDGDLDYILKCIERYVN